MTTLIPSLTADDLMSIFFANSPRRFTKGDWMGFAGCEGVSPCIAEIGDDSLIIVDVTSEGVAIQAFDFNDNEDEPIISFDLPLLAIREHLVPLSEVK